MPKVEVPASYQVHLRATCPVVRDADYPRVCGDSFDIAVPLSEVLASTFPALERLERMITNHLGARHRTPNREDGPWQVEVKVV